MTKERFHALIQITGPIAPEGLENYVDDLSCDEKELLPREALQYVLDWNHVPDDQQDQLFSALDAVNAIPELVELGHIMAQAQVSGGVCPGRLWLSVHAAVRDRGKKSPAQAWRSRKI